MTLHHRRCMSFEEWVAHIREYYDWLMANGRNVCKHSRSPFWRRGGSCPGWSYTTAGVAACGHMAMRDGFTGALLTVRVLDQMERDGWLPLGMCETPCRFCLLMLDQCAWEVQGIEMYEALAPDDQRMHDMYYELLRGAL